MRTFERCLLGIACLALLVPGCTPDTPEAPTAVENEDPPVRRAYGALGNSLTAGFINGGLVVGGQEAGYPAVIAGQAGWPGLAQPLIAEPGLGSAGADGLIRGALEIDENGRIVSPVVGSLANALALLRNASHPIPYDNLGIPGAITLDLVNATSSATANNPANPFFDLILRNSALPPFDLNAIEQMQNLSPRAVTLWIGSNDVLGGVLAGDPELGVNVTPPEAFAALFDQVADAVDAIGAEYVAVANVPAPLNIPYVTTVPIGTVVEGLGFVPWSTDEIDVEYVLLTAPVTNPDSAAAYLPPPVGNRSLASRFTLTATEVQRVEDAAAAFNDVIEAEAADRDWALVDIQSALAGLPSDPRVPENLAVLNAIFPWLTDPSTGEPFQNRLAAFSLDGVHPSEKGYATAANAFIEAFNQSFGLGIDPIDVGQVTNRVGFPNAPGALSSRGFRSSPGGPYANPVSGPTPIEESARQVLLALPALVNASR